MMKLLRNLYLPLRFFYGLGAVVLCFAISFSFDLFWEIGVIALLGLFACTLVDVIILFSNKEPYEARRHMGKVFSLGDENKIVIKVKSKLAYQAQIKLIDELPYQLQVRSFTLSDIIQPHSEKEFEYYIRPLSRGKYQFKSLNFFIQSKIGLVERRFILEQDKEIAVYPSINQMKNFELRAVTSISHFQGIKKIRRIGHSYEFEQIKTYINGDDPRSINWKASSRTGQLMVNQYEDEKSQPIYSVIDKSRIMKMPFNGLSLLDYAINTSLVISNIALKKHDKAGLLTFGDKLGAMLKAQKSYKQLDRIQQALYAQKEGRLESDYELLYSAIRNFIRGRSLIFLFSNFESLYALERVLPLLRKINQMHLLVVMFFENTEFGQYAQEPCSNLLEIYQHTAAKQLINEKSLILQELQAHGIQAIKTRPEDLSLSTVNKYLELKARGYI